jgi:hypothetical protein
MKGHGMSTKVVATDKRMSINKYFFEKIMKIFGKIA